MSTPTTAAVVESAGAPSPLSTSWWTTLDRTRSSSAWSPQACATRTSASMAGALPFPLPGVLGHEGAGVVEAVGSGGDLGRARRPGPPVVHLLRPVPNCRDGHPAYCDTWLPANLIGGRRPDGTSTITRDGKELGGHFFGQSSFARHALVDDRSVVKVDPR